MGPHEGAVVDPDSNVIRFGSPMGKPAEGAAATVDTGLAGSASDVAKQAVSLWLTAGVPATQVAEWAGHSVHVLMRVYAKCINGQDEAARRRIEAALTMARRSRPPVQPAETPTRLRHDESGEAGLRRDRV